MLLRGPGQSLSFFLTWALQILFPPLFPRSLENQVVRDGERDLYIKLTYSVYRTESDGPSSPSGSSDKDKDRKKPRKWHLSTQTLPSLDPTPTEMTLLILHVP